MFGMTILPLKSAHQDRALDLQTVAQAVAVLLAGHCEENRSRYAEDDRWGGSAGFAVCAHESCLSAAAKRSGWCHCLEAPLRLGALFRNLATRRWNRKKMVVAAAEWRRR
jgi:hypothetical protein